MQKLRSIAALSFFGVASCVVQGWAASNNFCVGNDATDIMMKVGPLCVDAYEASVWQGPLKSKVQVSGSQPADYCNQDGNDCVTRYALSVADKAPAVDVTWFQAQQLCANSGKRLLTNVEWQMAAAGTFNDPSVCNETNDLSVEHTGGVQHPNCVSRWGIHDMIGNVWEWVGFLDRRRIARAGERSAPT